MLADPRAAIAADGAGKSFSGRWAVRNASFSIPPGAIVGLLGPNGAGKTTLLRMLATYLAPDAGAIWMHGARLPEQAALVRRLIGYLPEGPPLYGDMTVEAMLRWVADVRGLPGDRRATVRRTLQATGLAEVPSRLVGHLSRGMRQRVGLAQALLHDPEVLLFDEPTAGLDPEQVVEARALISGLRGRHTVVLSSHLLGEVAALCDRVLVIDGGRVLADEPTSTLLARVGSPDASLEGAYLEVVRGSRSAGGARLDG